MRRPLGDCTNPDAKKKRCQGHEARMHRGLRVKEV